MNDFGKDFSTPYSCAGTTKIKVKNSFGLWRSEVKRLYNIMAQPSINKTQVFRHVHL
jgi:hypothetical protein